MNLAELKIEGPETCEEDGETWHEIEILDKHGEYIGFAARETGYDWNVALLPQFSGGDREQVESWLNKTGQCEHDPKCGIVADRPEGGWQRRCEPDRWYRRV